MAELKKLYWYKTVTRKVKLEIYHDVSEYSRNEKSITFLIPGAVTMKCLGWCRFRYWQVLPYDSQFLMLVVYKEF